MELINREEAWKAFENANYDVSGGMYGKDGYSANAVWDILCDTKPIDAEEVVRCKDCIFAEHYENTAGAVECKHSEYRFDYGNGYTYHPIVPGNHFCGYGKRADAE